MSKWSFWLVLLVVWALPTVMHAQTTNRAALVVRFDDDNVVTRCVAFSEPEISGFELLARSGLQSEANFENMGGAVCRIEETGCPPNNCFCQCAGGASCVYWSYWHLADDGWQYSRVAATTFQVGDQSVQGWSWGEGAVNSAIAPPPISFAEVCALPAAQSTATPAAVVAPPQQGENAEERITDWLPYLAFILLVAGLVFALLKAQRRQAKRKI